MGMQAQSDFLEELRNSKKAFENDVAKLGYKRTDADKFVRIFGTYALSVQILPLDSTFSWFLDAYWNLNVPYELEGKTIWHAGGQSYDVKILKEEQKKLLDYLQNNFIPGVKSKAELPKELTDLLKEK
jgi:hypothetical protein